MTAKEIVIEDIKATVLSNIYSYEEMVQEWLFDNDYDGLYRDECGCDKDDLMPCGEDMTDCKPAYASKCDGKCAGECEAGDTHYGPAKQLDPTHEIVGGKTS